VVTSLPRLPYAARLDGPVVFCAGGSDPHGALGQMTLAGPLPPTPPWIALQPSLAAQAALPAWVRVEPFARDWLRRAGLVVTTWGVTVYETLYCGTPTLMVTTGEATEGDATCLEMRSGGAVKSLGVLGTLYPGMVRTAVQGLSRDPEERTRMAAASLNLVDGGGAARAAAALLTLEV